MKTIKLMLWIYSFTVFMDCKSKTETPKNEDTPEVTVSQSKIDLSKWNLVWQDEFDYQNEELDENWISQNEPAGNIYVMCSRWRENAVVQDGILELINKKESRGGADWTSGSIWTKKTFGYGYFEARYKYADASGTNNSFWFYPKNGVADGQKACEFDVNEGHWPNVINTNIHNWTDTIVRKDGTITHPKQQVHHTLVGEPNHSIVLETPIKTKKIRLSSLSAPSLHIRDFRIYGPTDGTYPKVGSQTSSELIDFARDKEVKISASGFYEEANKVEYAVDGNTDTSWNSQKHEEKVLEFEWVDEKTIGAIQFANGWPDTKGAFRNLMSDYVIQYYNGKDWLEIANYKVADEHNYAKKFHTYGMDWNESKIDYYLDGKLIYSAKNEVCFGETNMFLSLAILTMDIAGPVTDAIDDTSMKVDYVRYYQSK